MRNWHWVVNRRLRRIGWDLQRWPSRTWLTEQAMELSRVAAAVPADHLADLAKVLAGYGMINSRGERSVSQLGQDAWVVAQTRATPGLRYLELGAFDPVVWSNTHVLRTNFGWTGVSVDPNPETAAKFAAAELSDAFREVAVGAVAGELFFISEGAMSRLSTSAPDGGPSNKVRVITPQQLLVEAHEIDYLSLDIEGGELELLLAWPWAVCRPGLITVEHNNRESDKLGIETLLANMGYRAVLPELTDFESWYVDTRGRWAS